MTYHEFRDYWLCSEHNMKYDKGASCPKCHPIVSNGKANTKKDVSEHFTSKSQVNTSKSQGVLKRFHKQKVSKSIFERFHNYGVKFEADVCWDALFSEAEVRLNNNVCYKRLDFPEAIVKVFKRSILVSLRSSMELKGLDVRSAEVRSRQLVFDVVSRLPKAIVVRNLDVVNTHNAFVNHPVAKHNLKVVVDGQARLISDHSKGYLELEAVDPVNAVSDSVLIEDDLRGLIASGLSRDFLASAIHELVKDREYYAENLRSHVGAIQVLGSNVSDLTNVVRELRVHAQVGGKGSPRCCSSPARPLQSTLVRWCL